MFAQVFLPLAVTLLVYYLMKQKTLVFLKNHWTDRSDRYRWWYHRNLSILEITRREAFASFDTKKESVGEL